MSGEFLALVLPALVTCVVWVASWNVFKALVRT